MFLTRLKTYLRLSAVRLTLSLLLVFAAVTALAWGGTYWFVAREMNRIVDARLTAQADLAADAVQSGADLPTPGFGQYIAVSSAQGSRGSLPFGFPKRPDGTYRHNGRGDEYRYLVRSLPGGATLVVAEYTDRQDELLETLSDGMRSALLGMLIAGLMAGFWFAWRGQKRLDRIRAGLAQVAQGQLKTQIILPGPQDDLSTLAEQINATTARLDHAMEQMRVQSSNIAHDLRTPLARLRAQIETSQIDLTEHNRPVSDDALGAALEQIDQIVGTFNALLRLARIESGAARQTLDNVDLADLTTQVGETFGPVIEDAGQNLNIDITEPAQIKGDRDLLVQLMANLIQNALRYGQDGQTITVRLHGSVLSVTDQGPGIPFAEREKVFQPLYQLETTRQSEGFGLGLSLVRAISELHDADLSLSDGDSGRGLRVTVRFPKFTNL